MVINCMVILRVFVSNKMAGTDNNSYVLIVLHVLIIIAINNNSY